MGRKDQLIFGEASVFEDFRRVSMREKVVGLEIFVYLDEVEVATGIFAGAARAGLAVANNITGVGDPSCFDQGA